MQRALPRQHTVQPLLFCKKGENQENFQLPSVPVCQPFCAEGKRQTALSLLYPVCWYGFRILNIWVGVCAGVGALLAVCAGAADGLHRG